MDHKHESANDGAKKSKTNIASIVYFIIAALFLITEHRARLSGWLSNYWICLLLLACPLTHLFMHTPLAARLAFLWRIFGFSGRIVYRDVRLFADDPLAIGLGINALSGHRSACCRHRYSPVLPWH